VLFVMVVKKEEKEVVASVVDSKTLFKASQD
jgi:hypothetical protein